MHAKVFCRTVQEIVEVAGTRNFFAPSLIFMLLEYLPK